MGFAAGQPPQQKTVNCAECELAVCGGRARAFHVLEQPRNLTGGKVWIEQEPCSAGNSAFISGLPQRLAVFGGTAILPYDRIVDRLSGLAVPNNTGFPLIGDANAR